MAIAPSVPPKTSLLKGIHGSSCVRTCLKRRLRSSSTSPGPSGFVSTLSATRSCPSHEGPSRRQKPDVAYYTLMWIRKPYAVDRY